ncbi:ATP-dependent RNA helicase HrpA [Allohahella marinimesophila]
MTDQQAAGSSQFDIVYPPELPISEHAATIIEAIRSNQVLVLAGETGSGKTTQLPKMCLQAGLGSAGKIAHTQPRRLAARALSSRIAAELTASGAPEGLVSYQIRFEDTSGPNTRVKVMTDGILLAETRRDKWLRAYDTIIIDEAHERSLNIDFLLGYLKRVLAKRPELKLIITSATIDVTRFSKHFNDAPVIEVSGRTYPVDVVYRPPGELELPDAIGECLELTREHERETGISAGDFLVFMVGEREIRETANALRKRYPDELDVLPLYSRLSSSEQNRIFNVKSGGKRRIILATNVAETSITVPGIRYVIDPGLVRISRYSFRNKIQQLPIEPVSKASANQRKGRCGRVAPGICFRLYDEEEFDTRPDFTEPELLRTNLASVILQMLDLKLGDIEQFPFLQAPASKLINDGYKLLHELNAVDAKRHITPVGRQLAVFPTDPRFGRMLLAANDNGVLPEMLIITSMLSIQDPRERPLEKRQQADEMHARFADDQSDFLSILKLWDDYEAQRQALSGNQLKSYAKQSFLSFMRMREWREIHRQLSLQCHRLGFKRTQRALAQPAESAGDAAQPQEQATGQMLSYEHLHQSLLSGLFMQTGSLLEIKPTANERKGRDSASNEQRTPLRQQKGAYEGPRNRVFFIAPGTRLRRKQPKWVMAAELTETSRVFARMLARIQPEWLEAAADHVLKDQYLEPYWSTSRGEALASLQRSLYGLVVVSARAVGYSGIDPVFSRELLLREGLIAPAYSPELSTQQALTQTPKAKKGSARRSRKNMQAKLLQLPFVAANMKMLEDVDALEARLRRRDLLVSEDELYSFYDSRIPAHVTRVADLLVWYKSLDPGAQHQLELTKADVMHTAVGDDLLSAFPDRFDWDGMQLGLRYEFKPGEATDGITLNVPLPALTQLPANRLEWLVPGLLQEKIALLLKGLPKQWRRHFVPVPETAARAASEMTTRHLPLREALSLYLKRLSGIDVPAEQWPPESALPEYLRIHIEALDEQGRSLAQGHDVHELRQRLEDKLSASAWAEQDNTFQKVEGITEWNFGSLQPSVHTERAGLVIEVYPFLADAKNSVTLDVHLDKAEAESITRLGLARLFLLRMPGRVSDAVSSLKAWRSVALLYSTIGQARDLLDDLLLLTAIRSFGLEQSSGFPRDAATFGERLKTQSKRFDAEARVLAEMLAEILQTHHDIQKQLTGKTTLAVALYQSELKAHLAQLVYPGFLLNTPYEWLREFPRYLTAAGVRLEKMPRNVPNERLFQDFMTREWSAFRELREKFRLEGRRSEALDQLRWMFEEYRVSYFAQTLGTRVKVSDKKIRSQFALVREAAG